MKKESTALLHACINSKTTDIDFPNLEGCKVKDADPDLELSYKRAVDDATAMRKSLMKPFWFLYTPIMIVGSIIMLIGAMLLDGESRITAVATMVCGAVSTPNSRILERVILLSGSVSTRRAFAVKAKMACTAAGESLSLNGLIIHHTPFSSFAHTISSCRSLMRIQHTSFNSPVFSSANRGIPGSKRYQPVMRARLPSIARKVDRVTAPAASRERRMVGKILIVSGGACSR